MYVGWFIMKKKRLELYRDYLLLIKYYKENNNVMSREEVSNYLDNQTNDRFDLYVTNRNENEKAKVKVLSLFR